MPDSIGILRDSLMALKERYARLKPLVDEVAELEIAIAEQQAVLDRLAPRDRTATGPQVDAMADRVMTMLNAHERGLPIGVLARELDSHSKVVASVLAKLEREGEVERPDPEAPGFYRRKR